MELKDFKDVVRVMTKEEFESAINEDIKFVERFKHFFKHDDVARIIEHVKSVLEASVDYFYPNHPEVEFEKDFNIQYDVNNILNKNRSVQGFLTSKNRFLTREEASELVRNNNQEMVVDRNAIREQLYSEDLY